MDVDLISDVIDIGLKALIFNEKFWKYLRKRNILTYG